MGLIDKLANNEQPNNTQAQSPAQPNVPQPLQSPISAGGVPLTPGPGTSMDAINAAIIPPGGQRPQAQAPAQSGSIIDQLADTEAKQKQQDQKQNVSSNTTEPSQDGILARMGKSIYGDMMEGFGIMGEQIGKAVPQSATGPLAFATHNIIEPYNQSMAWASKTAGELAEKAAVFGTPYTVEQAREKFPRTMGITGSLAETAGGLVADPRNWPLMAGSLAKPILNRLMSAGFAAQMGSGVKDQAKELAENWDNLSPYERWKQGTSLGLSSAMTVGAATHAMESGPKPLGPENKPKGYVAPKPGVGERTTLRPTTVKTAGVEAPILASQQENPSLITRLASGAADAGKKAEFQREQTRPAAVRQLNSTLSQRATDAIAAHDALANGEQAPPPITGTDTPGRHTHPDQIWPEMQRSAEQTWEKARTESKADVATWERERQAAEQEHQANIDEHNKLVDAHNATSPEDKMPRAEFDADDLDLRDKPKTFDELKGELENAWERATDDNTEVRQKARDTEVPKAQKAFDKWFADHEDKVSKPEYDSAQQLWADSMRFREIADKLRTRIETGKITGDSLRSIGPAVDKKAMGRRGAAGIGEFKRLLGPEAYDNFQKVSKLFDPLEQSNPLRDKIPSWAHLVLSQVIPGISLKMFGPEAGLIAEGAVLASKAGKWLLNKIMFNPAAGDAFGKVVDETKAAYGTGNQVNPTTLQKFGNILTRLWKDESGEMVIPGTGGKPKGDEPEFNLQDNGVDEDGNKNHLLSISHKGEHIGHLNISQKTPESWTVNDASVRPDKQGQGFGTKAYQEAFKQAAAQGMKFVESDISTSKAAAKTWNRLAEIYPDAVTEDNGQYTADLSKINAPEVSTDDQASRAKALWSRIASKFTGKLDETAARARAAEVGGTFKTMPISELNLDRLDAPRMSDKESAKLTESIKKNGVQQPLLVGRDPRTGTMIVLDGSHRVRAAIAAGLKEVPVIQFRDRETPVNPIEKIDREADQIAAHNANGGSTFTPEGEDLFGKDKYAVGQYPSRTEQLDNLEASNLKAFKEKNADALSQPGHAVGTWLDTETGKHVLDVTRVYDNREEAIRAGKAQNQKAIYHLGGEGEIQTGGGGDFKGTTKASVREYASALRDNPDAASLIKNHGRDMTVEEIANEMRDRDILQGVKDGKPQQAFVSVAPDGTISRVINNAKDSVASLDLIRAAIERGGDKIDAWDIDGKLPKIYEGLGFEKVRTVPYDVANYGEPSKAYKDHWKRFGWKEGDPYPSITYMELPKGDTGFDTGTLDQENTADQEAYRKGLAANEIATRQPSQDKIDPVTKKKTTITPPNDPGRLSGLAALNEANETPSGRGNANNLSMKQKLVAAFAGYENTGLKLTQEDINNPDQAIEKIVNHIQDNYQWVYDNMPDSIRQVAQQWYETVHNSTKAEAEKTGLSHAQVAGVVAAYSPQNPWDNNRESAYKMIDLVQNQSNHQWSPEMDTTLQNIKDVNTSVKPGAPGLTNGQIAFGKTADAIRGKTFHDFDSEPDKEIRQGLQALWLRVLDEAHTEDRSIPTMNPNGEIMGHAGTRAWPGLDVMARGLDIILNGRNEDGSPNLELINEHLGGGNKVRNFYNNMINPWSERGHFTADTHQVGAGLLQAVSSKSVEAMHNFGSGNKKGIASPGKNGPTGVKGTYPVYQEAGVRAAEKNGVRPNQFQSMSWEGIRSLMGDDKKTPALEQAIRSIWEQHENGELSKTQARDMILKASGGFTKPEWMSQAAWDADQSPNKAENVLATRTPEETPEAIVDAAKTRKVRQQMEQKAQKRAEQAVKAEQKAKGGGAKPAGKRGL